MEKKIPDLYIEVYKLSIGLKNGCVVDLLRFRDNIHTSKTLNIQTWFVWKIYFKH